MKIRCGTDILRVSRIENIKNLDKFMKKSLLNEKFHTLNRKIVITKRLQGCFVLKKQCQKL